MKELCLHQETLTSRELGILVESFPNLVTLEAESKTPYSHKSSDTWIPKEHSLALSRISCTLTTLTLTNGFNTWNDVLLGWDVPALLTRLDELTRPTHLTTESVWLFGRPGIKPSRDWDPTAPVPLPSSLISLHLLDFTLGGDVEYYPIFPNWTPIQFYDHQLSLIHGKELPSLREILFSTDWSELSVNEDDTFDNPSHAADSIFSAKFSRFFGDVGVRFLILDLEDVEDVSLRSQWVSAESRFVLILGCLPRDGEGTERSTAHEDIGVDGSASRGGIFWRKGGVRRQYPTVVPGLIPVCEDNSC